MSASDFIPLCRPDLAGRELEYLTDCIESGWISSGGQYVGRFEAAFAAAVGSKHAIATESGTAALRLALGSVGVGPGDEVIVPDVTFGATANAVVACGATPHFVDIRASDWTIDPNLVTRSINARTKAIVPVHLYGHPAAMTALDRISKAYDLPIVEDCAQALCAKVDGAQVGTLSRAGCFSFFGNKTISTGEGGAVVTDNDTLAARMRMIRNQGLDPERRYWHQVAGFNHRMTNLQAAIGVAQLERLDAFLAHRADLDAEYRRLLKGVVGVASRGAQSNVEAVCWLHTLLLPDGGTRERLAEGLLKAGIETRPVFPPLSTQPAFARYPRNIRGVGADVAARGLSLPTSNATTREDVARVCARLAETLRVQPVLQPA